MLYSNKAIKEEVDLSNNEKYDMQKLLWLMAISYKGYAKSQCKILLPRPSIGPKWFRTCQNYFWICPNCCQLVQNRDSKLKFSNEQLFLELDQIEILFCSCPKQFVWVQIRLDQ